MNRAILVRHGESETNLYGIISSDYDRYPLTQYGREQVTFIAPKLAELKFDGIITSPILRAVQTARIIANKCGLEILTDDRVRESGFGPYNNMHISEIPWKSREDMKMEPWESHVKRMREVINEYDGSYIIVSHAYPIKALICDMLGMGEDDCYSVEIKNASMSAIDVTNGRVLSIGTFLISDRVKRFFS
ncbi:phosphoglycerate mutase [Thermoplasma volcanium GSS1]|uniref:Phosphoglycerate mutase n=1 Tax=Thermoplasma volcanium (strain ATCC 51530 / DSM 4299 / JCM 9571 / NBRC 15438 / GSS1) TaxID=273116 RepID=Q97AR8_THEVO|nr:2,3-diphosphoglycerate-dependent phosphoglycerate mutase [Thermoplasma volcanium]BAB59883.1 phosphoglycerate mutase [Thermoplasma volcanium GSS1]